MIYLIHNGYDVSALSKREDFFWAWTDCTSGNELELGDNLWFEVINEDVKNRGRNSDI